MNNFYKKLEDNNLSTSLLNLAVYSVLKKDIAKEKVTLNDIEESKVSKLIDEICLKNRPAQYICGYENFYGYFIKVDENVLIPRFETEELVYNLICEIEKTFTYGDTISLLDLCCGSGCISIALYNKLKDKYNIILTSVDISLEALKLCEQNFKEHNVTSNIIQSDFLTEILSQNLKFDVIVSNPPYIDENDVIDELVSKHEPHLALYAPNNGLYFYYKLIDNLKLITNKKSITMVEIGDGQFQPIKNYNNEYEYTLYRDNFNRERIVKII